MCGWVRCPTCRGEKFLQVDQFGSIKPIAAFDLVSAQRRGVETGRCHTCSGEGLVTQIESDYAVMEQMHLDLLLHRVFSQ